MSFMIYRAKKLRKMNILNGGYLAEIIKIERDKSDRNAWYVEFRLFNEGIVRNRYVDNPEKYSPLDSLIDAALGTDSGDVDLNEIIGCYVKVTVVNEGRYTNVKKVNSLNKQDMEELERYQDEASSSDNVDNESTYDDSYDEDESDELDEEELDLEDDPDDEDDPEDEPESSFEEPQKIRLGFGLGRRRQI
ncbi:hypothetical protein [Paenibacillus chitinolyticus]